MNHFVCLVISIYNCKQYPEPAATPCLQKSASSTWYMYLPGPEVAQWLRRCATSRKVLGSIPCGVIGFLNHIFSSDQTMALGSTQPLVKMSTRNIPGDKGGRCVRLTTYHHSVPLSRNLGDLTGPVMGDLYLLHFLTAVFYMFK